MNSFFIAPYKNIQFVVPVCFSLDEMHLSDDQRKTGSYQQ